MGVRYVQLSDSLQAVQQTAENAYALLKYDKSEAEKEALAAKVDKQRILSFGNQYAICGALRFGGYYYQSTTQKKTRHTRNRTAHSQAYPR